MFNKHKLLAFVFVLILSLFSVSEIKAQVEINEFVPDASPEWVELFNASDSAEYIRACYIDDDTNFLDDAGSSTKKILSGLDISNTQYPFIDLSSFLNNSGDSVVLFGPDGTIIDQYLYSANPGNGVSIGRSPDHTGNFTILSSPTKGNENSAPLVISTDTPIPTSTALPINTPAPTLTPTPTKTPTPVPTKSPTPKATSTPLQTASGQATSEETAAPQSFVLGLEDKTAGDEASGSAEEKKSFSFLPFLFIAAGLVCIGVALFLVLKKGKAYNGKSEENI